MKRLWAALLLSSLLLSLDLLAQVSGAADFPLYSRDDEMGYIVGPSQSGAYLHTHSWCFNDKSMPVCDDYRLQTHPNLLLIGNSIVMGGNRFAQEEKLPQILQSEVGPHLKVWPAAIGGWTAVNEMGYLYAHREIVANADVVGWEYMAGGLSGMTPWQGEYIFPTQRPLCLMCYLFRRYALPRLSDFFAASELPLTGLPQAEDVEKFDSALRLATRDGKLPGFIWLYPTLSQLADARKGREWLPERATVTTLAKKYNMDVVDVAAAPEWTYDKYYSDGIHLTIAGNVTLAKILRPVIAANVKGKAPSP